MTGMTLAHVLKLENQIQGKFYILQILYTAVSFNFL